MNVDQLTEREAKRIISNIIDVLQSDTDWSPDTIDSIVDQLGKLWNPQT